ncbi:integrase [Cytobacillus horneckiae]|uniref:site-specific integrase n=1 Tax=Cytobacillus horneckiae TaxID=549687 RepID=UPI0019D0D29A|nr:site-specific integrase [Cytobacillus horneckiae]MBN6886205.1 site-specific integrase [Cytobacillus horneckiae]
MASFTKRGNTWQYTVSRMIGGKSKPIRKGGFRTKKEAMVAAAEVEGKLNKGFNPVVKLTPLNDYFEQWVGLYKTGIKKGTQTHYKNTLRIINEHFPSTPIQHITKNDYQMFINNFGKNKSKETVKKLNAQIRSCVKDAVDDGLIHSDFTRKAIISGRDAKSEEEKHISYSESKELTNAIHGVLDNEHRLVYYIILLALKSGMRFSELVALTRSDFDFKHNTININKSWGYNPSTEDGARSTKTKNSNRIIKMDKRTMDIFKNLFEVTPENIHKLIFYNPASKYKVYSNTGVNKALKKLLNDLGIDEISIHGLRHTHASILFYKGISIQYISERLGHADVDTTIRIYTHLIKELRKIDEDNTVKVLAAL